MKDNVATGDYFSDKKGVFKNTSGLDLAKERAEELNNPKKGVLQTLKDKVMGTKQQNEEATERMRKMDEKNPDSAQAKTNKALGMKAGGKVSSASKRADGCATKGKTKGRMV